MADPKLVAEWLSKADEDFHFTEINLREEIIFDQQLLVAGCPLWVVSYRSFIFGCYSER